MTPDEIKLAMRAHLRERSPSALIVDEFGINGGNVIADVALFDEHLSCGYEIKSAADSVKRLPGQVTAYSRVFDRCAIVCDPKHVGRAEPLLPAWWGIILIEDGRFFLLRELAPNPSVDVRCLIKLIWRDEALRALQGLGLGRGYSAARRGQLWKRLCDILSPEQVQALVRATLRGRQGWLLDDGRRKAARIR